MIKKYLTIIVISFFSFGFSQKEQDSIVIPEDKSEAIKQRSYNADLNNKYSGEDFDYGSAEGEAQNIMDRFLNWLSHLLGDSLGVDIHPATLAFIEYTIYVLMAGLAIYLLVKFLVGENLSSIFSKKATAIVDINLSEEHIENIDLDKLLKEALEQNNYRLAVRYHYLRVLKNLSIKNIIEWQYEKTNVDYQQEITDTKLKPLFQEVSYLYDYIWYGEQEIDETKFKAAEKCFTKLKNSIPN